MVIVIADGEAIRSFMLTSIRYNTDPDPVER